MNCKFVINKMPVIEYAEEISRKMGNGFKLFDGRAAETSGGLLIVVKKEHVSFLYLNELFVSVIFVDPVPYFPYSGTCINVFVR